MRSTIQLLGLSVLVGLAPVAALAQQPLPADVDPHSRNRLPAVSDDAPAGVEGIRRRASGLAVRWEWPPGRALTELAILVTAREHDQPYEWSLHEMEAVAVGLDARVIDVVRNAEPLAGLDERQAAIIELGRELFAGHELRPETYARAVRILGQTNLVDIVSLMGNYVAVGTRLTAFNQQMPPGWRQFLPLPFTPPDDIHADSRSRLPYVAPRPGNAASAPPLYARSIAPEGTGPGHIRRHGAGLASLEASVGRRLTALAVLVTAREHDSQYQWTLNELTALEHGLEPAVIDVVRHRRALTGLGEREAALIRFGRELFGQHRVSAQTYARALGVFGERDLVDFVDLMAQHAGEATLLLAFDQQLPAGQPPLLPIP